MFIFIRMQMAVSHYCTAVLFEIPHSWTFMQSLVKSYCLVNWTIRNCSGSVVFKGDSVLQLGKVSVGACSVRWFLLQWLKAIACWRRSQNIVRLQFPLHHLALRSLKVTYVLVLVLVHATGCLLEFESGSLTYILQPSNADSSFPS